MIRGHFSLSVVGIQQIIPRTGKSRNSNISVVFELCQKSQERKDLKKVSSGKEDISERGAANSCCFIRSLVEQFLSSNYIHVELLLNTINVKKTPQKVSLPLDQNALLPTPASLLTKSTLTNSLELRVLVFDGMTLCVARAEMCRRDCHSVHVRPPLGSVEV